MPDGHLDRSHSPAVPTLRCRAALLALVACGGVLAACGGSEDGAALAPEGEAVLPVGHRPIEGFEVFESTTDAPDPIGHRLCAETASWDDPDAEKHDISCELEGANLAAEAPDPDADHLLVMTWNLERNYELDAEIAAFADGTIPVPDVLLASEVDRGCDRSDGVDGGWELAEAVGLNYVFGVEFVEGARPEGAQDALSAPCEHGQAIFSRYPIGNVELFRHVNTGTDRWDDPDEPRIGTRADLEADIAVGDRLVHVVSVHYDDQVTEAETAARAGQARVTAERGLDHDIPTVVGGDMNTAFYLMDATPTAARAPAAKAFWDLGWHDTHVGIADRVTAPRELAGSEVNAIVDLLWVRDPATVSEQGWCDPADCAAISDHLPQWFRWELPSA